MKRWSLGSMMAMLAGGLLLWVVVAGACLLVGSTGMRWPPTWTQLESRWEPVLLSSLVGAALAAAGVAYQAILRNPLADPYLLGISSGASLASFLWRFPAAALLGAAGAISQQAFAFGGAMASVAVVLFLGSRRGRLEPLTLLLVGVIVNAVNGSIFLLVNSMVRDMTAQSGGAIAFLVGGIQTNLTTLQEVVPAVLMALGWIVLLYIGGELNATVLGDAEAESLGVRIRRLRWIGLIAASAVTAAAVSISGPIGFVGLICPHLARLIVGSDVRRLLPISTAMGAVLLTLADAASRFLAGPGRAQTLLPVGVLTGFLGGPFFLLLLWQHRRRATEGDL